MVVGVSPFGRGPGAVGVVGEGVGQAGVVVDRGVDVVEPDAWCGAGSAVLVAVAAADLPPSAVSESAQFLDIDVDQFARGARVRSTPATRTRRSSWPSC